MSEPSNPNDAHLIGILANRVADATAGNPTHLVILALELARFRCIDNHITQRVEAMGYIKMPDGVGPKDPK